jgi:sulfate transport system permease protein
LLVVGAFLAVVLLVPIGALLVSVLGDARSVAEQVVDSGALDALRLSVVLAIVALIVNGAVGVLGACVLARQRFWGRRILDALVDVPLSLSPVMTGLAFLLLFGRGGWLTPALDALDVRLTFAFPGLLIATLFVTLPFTVREVALLLEQMGTSEEDAAATLGASPWQVFWYVTLPNIRHGLAVGATLTVARALGEFGAVLVVGGAISGKTQTATTFIYAAMEERRETAAYGVALLLAVAAASILVALQRRKRQGV